VHDIPFAWAQPRAINFFVFAVAILGEIKCGIDYSRLFGCYVLLKLGCGGVIGHLIVA
jgi:hypothetical protein